MRSEAKQSVGRLVSCRSIKEIKAKITEEEKLGRKTERHESKYGYPKINSTAHFQRAAILRWVLKNNAEVWGRCFLAPSRLTGCDRVHGRD